MITNQLSTMAERATSTSQDIFSHLLTQPTELIGDILQWLDLKDLLNLRRVNHTLHALVHCHEKSICARYCRQLQREHRALQLPTKIYGLTNDLLFYIELHRRYRAIYSLACLLSSHIISRIQVQHPDLDKVQIEQWRSRKADRLTNALFPALFLYNNFLECLYATHVRSEGHFSTWEAEELLTLHDVYDLDQQRIIEDFDPCTEEVIIDVSAASSILLGSMKSKRVSMSMRASKYPFATVKRVLLASGILPFIDILSPNSSAGDLRTKLDQASEDIWRGKGRKPVTYDIKLKSIHHLRTERLYQISAGSEMSNHKVQNRFIERQDIWNKAAFAVVQRLGSAEALPLLEDTHQWLRLKMAEPGDPTFSIGNWRIPSPT